MICTRGIVPDRINLAENPEQNALRANRKPCCYIAGVFLHTTHAFICRFMVTSHITKKRFPAKCPRACARDQIVTKGGTIMMRQEPINRSV